MNIADNKKAPKGLTYEQYVDFLNDNHYLPADSKDWVTFIRRMGNEPNHVITARSSEDAKTCVTFVQTLLGIIYEYPKKLPPMPQGE